MKAEQFPVEMQLVVFVRSCDDLFSGRHTSACVHLVCMDSFLHLKRAVAMRGQLIGEAWLGGGKGR